MSTAAGVVVARLRPGRQPLLPLPNTWGGRRKRAGRKRAPGRPVCVPHRTRPQHRAEHPVHITLRANRRLRVLRRESVFLAVRGAMAATGRAAIRTGRATILGSSGGAHREGTMQAWRLVAFSVQTDHVHLIIEAADRAVLSRGLRGLTIRMARAVNRVLGRRGRVWSDRYYRRDLATPREVRNALVYVLMNHKKHMRGIEGQQPFDPCSSAAWFDGWAGGPGQRCGRGCGPDTGPPGAASESPPIAPPRTWLLRVGWRRYGLLRSSERPSSFCSKALREAVHGRCASTRGRPIDEGGSHSAKIDPITSKAGQKVALFRAAGNSP